MKALSKKELAEKMGVSSSTLQNLLNRSWYKELKIIGYFKRQKIMTIKQLELIKEYWGNFDV